MVGLGNAAWLRALELLAVSAAAAAVCYALATGSARRHYDVDEIQHAHVMWRISVGDRPFHDFVESHPPFVWYLGAPLVKAIPTPADALRVFRGLATSCGLVFVGLLLACVRVRQPALTLPWLAAGGLLVLCHRSTLDYFVEARPDSLAYCLLFAAFGLFLRERPQRVFARYATFAFLASTALLWTPKFALLVVALAAAELIRHGRSAAAAGIALAGHATGIGLAVAGALVFLRLAGIDPLLAYDLSIGFHARFLDTTSFSHGLWRSIVAQPVQLAFACAGVLAWIALVLARRIRPAPFELAALVFLAVTPFLMPLPYKQYFAPWFALSAVFIPFLGLGLRQFSDKGARLAAALVLAFAAVSAWRVGRDYARADQAGFFRLAWQLMQGAALPGGRAVADPQWHPVYRRDVFYGWFSTFDPGGRNQERILREWNPRGYGARFTAEGYRDEIARQPPALIVTVGDGFNLPATQEAVVARFVREHRGEYLGVPLAGKLGLLVRRDQADWKYLQAAGHALRP
jgi:hypothetical protein